MTIWIRRECLAGDTGIDLCGLDVGMPQHLGDTLHRYAFAERHCRKGMASQMEGEPLLYATHVGYLLEVGIHLLVGEDGEELPVLGSRTRAILLDDGLGMSRRMLLSTLVFFLRVMIHAFPSRVTRCSRLRLATSM